MRSRRLFFAFLTLAGGCDDQVCPDLATTPDLAMTLDLALADMAVAPDLAGLPDLAMKPDLAGVPFVVSFAAGKPIVTSCASPGYLVTADFNKDGKPDLAIYGGGKVCALVGN